MAVTVATASEGHIRDTHLNRFRVPLAKWQFDLYVCHKCHMPLARLQHAAGERDTERVAGHRHTFGPQFGHATATATKRLLARLGNARRLLQHPLMPRAATADCK